MFEREEDVLLRILRGQSTAKVETKAGALEIWQNMHETAKFEEVLGS